MLSPRTVAVIGVSEKPGSVGRALMEICKSLAEATERAKKSPLFRKGSMAVIFQLFDNEHVKAFQVAKVLVSTTSAGRR